MWRKNTGFMGSLSIVDFHKDPLEYEMFPSRQIYKKVEVAFLDLGTGLDLDLNAYAFLEYQHTVTKEYDNFIPFKVSIDVDLWSLAHIRDLNHISKTIAFNAFKINILIAGSLFTTSTIKWQWHLYFIVYACAMVLSWPRNGDWHKRRNCWIKSLFLFSLHTRIFS